MFPILQVGPLAVQVPGLVLLLGVWVGLSLAEKEAARLGLPAPVPPWTVRHLCLRHRCRQDRQAQVSAQAIYNTAFTGLVAGVIGARLAYAARYPGAYLSDPLGLLSLTPATLAPTEGALVGVAAAIAYGARRRLPLRPTLNAFAPALGVMGVALAAAHLASGDAFGAPTSVPWSIYLWDEQRHPSQVYELVGALGVLGVWWRVRGRASFAGFNFLLVLGLSAAARVFLEAFRGDSLLVLGGLRAAQVWGLIVLAASLAGLGYWGRQAVMEEGHGAGIGQVD